MARYGRSSAGTAAAAGCIIVILNVLFAVLGVALTIGMVAGCVWAVVKVLQATGLI